MQSADAVEAAVLRHLPDVVVHLRADATIRFANPAALAFLGVTEGSLTGRPLTDLVHPDDGDAVRDLLDDVVGHHGPGPSLAFRLRTARHHHPGHHDAAHDEGADWRHVEAVAVNVVGDPDLRGVVMSIRPFARSPGGGADPADRDETARKETDREHSDREQAERDEVAVFGTTPNLVLVLDAAGHIVKLNPAAEAMTGTGTDAAHGTPLTSVVLDAGGSESLASLVRRMVALGRPVPMEGDLWSAAGDRRRIRWESALFTGLDGRVSRVVMTGSDITAQREAEESLREMETRSRHAALHDSLTGLANRALLLDRLQQALALSERTGRRIALLFIDLDRFKLVNDGFGHGVGDRLLCEIAERLSTTVRGHDTVARLGGDEFVVLLEGLRSQTPAVEVGERIVAALADPVTINGIEHFVTASVGVAVSRTGSTSEDLLAEADTAMYRAKAAGKGRLELFDDHLREEVLVRVQTEAALRRAVDHGEIAVWFQPQVNLRTGAIVGLEALVRWEHPTRGLLLPAAFLPVAEETGLITPIWDLVVAISVERLVHWRHRFAHHADLRMSVNLSPRQLGRGALTAELADRLHRHGLPPGALCVELSEGALGDVTRSARTIEELRETGVRVAIDDFGTGVASLGHLRMFPVDELKVDGMFVANVVSSKIDHGIVAAVVELARAVGARVVAEGVETVDVAHRCRQLGVTVAQGHLFSRPAPAETVEALLARELPFAALTTGTGAQREPATSAGH